MSKPKQVESSAHPFSVRQGDVLLVDAAYRGGIPDGATAVPRESGRIVFAHGEVTGHAHVIERPKQTTQYFDKAAERYLKILESEPQTHEEHSVILLSPDGPHRGELQQAFQVEDFGEEVRRVAD